MSVAPAGPREGAPWATPGTALAAMLVAVSPALAQSLDGYVELSPTHVEQTSTVPGEPEARTNSDVLVERLNFTYSQPLWPYLQLQTGGFFERSASDGDVSGVPFESTVTRLRPFGRVLLSSPTFRAELGFDRNETRNRTDAFSSTLVRDTWRSSFGWYPNASAYLQALLSRRDDHDAQRLERNRITRTATLDARVRPTIGTSLQYRGQFESTDDRVGRGESDSASQSARAAFHKSFWDRRLTIGSDYNVDRIRVSSRSTRPEAALVRVVPVAGRSAIDDFPERDPLPPNPALVDGDRTAPAGVDLGLPAPSGDARRRNFGVEFGLPREVRRIWVWIDRELRPEVAASFVWEIWTSDDNDVWTLRRTVAGASFGPFDNRFDLAFDAVVARHLKIVTQPLAPTVPFASDYPVIQVTELETFTRARGSEQTDTAQRFSFDSRVRLLDAPSLHYDLNYLWNTITGGRSQTFLVNGLSLAHGFGDIWSVAARVANERNDDGDVLRVSDVLSASLTAVPLPTLRSSVIVGGRRETFAGDRRKASSVVWNASATPYRGIDFNLNLGGAWQVEIDGRRTGTTLAGVGAEIVPHRAVVLNVTYQDDSRTETGAGRPTVDDPSRALDVSVTLSPLPSLYAFASRRQENRSTTGRRTLHNYSLSWSPFPYGTLRFSVFYNEYFQSDLHSLTRTGGPSLRWNIARRTYLNVTYERTSNDSDLQTLDRNVLYGSLHFGF